MVGSLSACGRPGKFDHDQGIGRFRWHNPTMAPFLFECPSTGLRVQGWAAEEIVDDSSFVPVECIACARLHLINPRTGKVLGEDSQKHE